MRVFFLEKIQSRRHLWGNSRGRTWFSPRLKQSFFPPNSILLRNSSVEIAVQTGQHAALTEWDQQSGADHRKKRPVAGVKILHVLDKIIHYQILARVRERYVMQKKKKNMIKSWWRFSPTFDMTCCMYLCFLVCLCLL
jgi:hypothetical protein